MFQTEFIQIITGFIGSLGFGILFNIRGKRLLVSAVGGLISWSAFLIFNCFIGNEPVCYLIVAFLISIYAEIMARVLKTPTTPFITTSLIPLIPGGSLYYTMAFAFKSDFESFLEKGLYTLELAATLALGIIIASALTRSFLKLNFRKNQNADSFKT